MVDRFRLGPASRPMVPGRIADRSGSCAAAVYSRIAVAMMCAIAMLMGSAAGVPPASGAATTEAEIHWSSCGDQLQCAKVPVPLVWSQPDGEHIKLAVIRHLASDPQRLIGSMFVNPGGPGQSGVQLVRDAGSELNRWGGGRFNVVSWDPRGTNGSDPVRCFTSRASQDAFWLGVQIPTTVAESRAYRTQDPRASPGLRSSERAASEQYLHRGSRSDWRPCEPTTTTICGAASTSTAGGGQTSGERCSRSRFRKLTAGRRRPARLACRSLSDAARSRRRGSVFLSRASSLPIRHQITCGWSFRTDSPKVYMARRFLSNQSSQ